MSWTDAASERPSQSAGEGKKGNSRAEQYQLHSFEPVIYEENGEILAKSERVGIERFKNLRDENKEGIPIEGPINMTSLLSGGAGPWRV